MLWQIVVLIVLNLLAAALAPKPEKPKPASMEDVDAPTADAAKPIPVVFGTVMITGPNVTWYGNLRADPIKSDGGKKG